MKQSTRSLIQLTWTSIYLGCGFASMLTPSSLLSWKEAEDALPCSFPFCADGKNCADPQCSGCPFNCAREENLQCSKMDISNKCRTWCKPETKSPSCSGCLYSKPLATVESQCSLGTFRDVTDSFFSGEDEKYWHHWLRSGKPHWHFSSALMVDLNGDSVLDYFTSMHGTMYNDDENGSSADIQVGTTIINESDLERPIHVKDASWKIQIDDPHEESEGYVGIIDKHGDFVGDLDNDGVLDILIMSGGGSGKRIPYPKSKDNILLFGEKIVDDDTGTEMTVFTGGRKQALSAGLEGRMGRGRISYVLGKLRQDLCDDCHQYSPQYLQIIVLCV